MADETYYSILEVSEVATAAEIKSAYIRVIRDVHPDRLANAPAYWQRQAEEKAKEVNEAYAVLSDREKRRLYDAQLASYRGTQGTNSGPSSGYQSSPNTAQQQTPPKSPRPAQSQQQAQQQPPQAAPQAAQPAQTVSASFKAWFWITWGGWSVVCLVLNSGWMIIVGLFASLFIAKYLVKVQRAIERKLAKKTSPQPMGQAVPSGPRYPLSQPWFWGTWTTCGLLGLAVGQIGKTGTTLNDTAALTGILYFLGGIPLAFVLAWYRDPIKQWLAVQHAAGSQSKFGTLAVIVVVFVFVTLIPVMVTLVTSTPVTAPPPVKVTPRHIVQGDIENNYMQGVIQTVGRNFTFAADRKYANPPKGAAVDMSFQIGPYWLPQCSVNYQVQRGRRT